MIVVSDASPLIALAAVGRLELLQRLYNDILIPEAVFREVTTSAPLLPGAEEVKTAQWIRVQPVQGRTLVMALSVELDAGEAEAIVLAIESGADLLLMDERRGRHTAVRLGTRVIGVLGVLIDAKKRDIVPEVRPLLDALETTAGFRIGAALYRRVLTAADECGWISRRPCPTTRCSGQRAAMILIMLKHPGQPFAPELRAVGRLARACA